MATASTLFTKAVRYQRFARIAMYAGSGHGKTRTSLEFAKHIVDKIGGRIAYIDTEKGSASLYATEPGKAPQRDSEFDFDHMVFDAPFTTARLTEAIKAAADDPTYTVLVIDSMSHFWQQEGGVLWQADMLQKTKHVDGFRAIAQAKRDHYYPLVEAIIDAKIHIIVTLRAKNEYDVSKDERGKTQITRLGTAPRMEEGFIYETDMVITLSDGAYARVDKTRYSEMDGATCVKPNGEWIAPFFTWLNGVAAEIDPYVYQDGAKVASTQAKRIFNEYRDEHEGEVPSSADSLRAWHSAKSAVPTTEPVEATEPE